MRGEGNLMLKSLYITPKTKFITSHLLYDLIFPPLSFLFPFPFWLTPPSCHAASPSPSSASSYSRLSTFPSISHHTDISGALHQHRPPCQRQSVSFLPGRRITRWLRRKFDSKRGRHGGCGRWSKVYSKLRGIFHVS